MLSITYRSKVMDREKFYHKIDDWVAYNFTKIDCQLPSPTFIGRFIHFVEAELAGYAESDRDKLMPWTQVNSNTELDQLLPICFTAYLNQGAKH
jgi:hypothetical protein